MESRTFDDWNDFGYFVKKGSKSCSRNKEGKALFTEDQVEKKKNFFESLDSNTMSELISEFGLDYDLPNR